MWALLIHTRSNSSIELHLVGGTRPSHGLYNLMKQYDRKLKLLYYKTKKLPINKAKREDKIRDWYFSWIDDNRYKKNTLIWSLRDINQ